jgi:hypothetical protein
LPGRNAQTGEIQIFRDRFHGRHKVQLNGARHVSLLLELLSKEVRSKSQPDHDHGDHEGQRRDAAGENTESEWTERRGYGVQVDCNLHSERWWRRIAVLATGHFAVRPEIRMERPRSD